MPSRFDLKLICDIDSSADTYKTEFELERLAASCKAKVDLPIPGSPPSSMVEPTVNPPPNTRSISIIEDSICSFDTVFKSDSLFETNNLSLFFLLSFFSSKQFHSLHLWHFPIFTGEVKPQFTHS